MIESPMSLDIGSQRMVIAMEIVSHKMGSYLFGQKSLRQMMNLLFSKRLVKFHTHAHTHTLIHINELVVLFQRTEECTTYVPLAINENHLSFVVPYCNQTT